MAIPDRYKDSPVLAQSGYGIVVGLYPSSDASFDVELWRAVGTTASTAFTKLCRLNPENGQTSLQFRDLLPNDDVYRYYRARHVKHGYVDGAYTTVARGKPASVNFSGQVWPNLPLTGNSIGVDLHLSAANSIKVGTAAASSYLTKRLRLNPASFQPDLNTRSYRMSDSSIALNAASSAHFFSNIDLPVGVTLVGARALVQKESTSSVVRCEVRYTNHTLSTGVITELSIELWGKTSTAAGGQILQSGSTDFTTLTTSTLTSQAFVVRLKSTGATPTNNKLLWAEVTYRMPSYDKTR